MTFTYNSFVSDQADNSLWSQITNKLNSLTDIQSDSAKIASSDMKGKDARAVIFYCQSEAPDPGILGTTWSYKVFETSSNYEGMYTDCVNFLNDTDELNDTQKYYARISMTNCSGRDSRLVLFYRELN